MLATAHVRVHAVVIRVAGAAVLLLAARALAEPASQPDIAKPTHKEVQVLGQTPATAFGELSTLAMDQDGNILGGDSRNSLIRVFSPDGKVLREWKPGLPPHAIRPCDDGTTYVGGVGKIVLLDKDGKVIKSTAAPSGELPTGKVSGLTVSDKDVFASFGKGGSLGAKAVIVRYDRDLTNPKIMATDQRGCCQRLDMVFKDGVLYVAENTRHHVVKYDHDGKKLGEWGKQDRKDLAGFGSCCNPMNLCFGSDGALYTTESGLGRIKRYTADGEFLGLVGFVEVPRFNSAGGLAASCSNMAMAVSKDGKHVYVQDVKAKVIRVLVSESATAPASAEPPAKTKTEAK